VLRAIALFSLLWAYADAAFATSGPSFDCAHASTTVEHSICADPSLSALDVEIAQNYAAALNAAGPLRDDLIAFQRAWLKQRGPECGLADKNPIPPAGMPPRTACLLALMKERNDDLKPPAFGYAIGNFPELRDGPPLRVQLLQEAFKELPYTPKAARHVFSSMGADVAKLGLLMAVRLYDVPSDDDTRLKYTLAAGLKKNSDRSHVLASYDGSVGSIIPYLQTTGMGLLLPCKLFVDFPDLIPATGAAFGSGADNFMPRAVCSDYEYPNPGGASALAEATRPYDGGAFGRCTGSIRFAAFADDRMYELVERAAPKILLQPGVPPRLMDTLQPPRVLLPPVPDTIPLESWSYQSVWNRHQFASFKAVFDKAARESMNIYETRWGFSPKEAAHAAHVALWLPLLWANAPPPNALTIAIMNADARLPLQPLLAAPQLYAVEGEPLLSRAAENPGAVRMLLATHVDPNATNDFGKTPLMTAAQFDQGETLQLLIKAGAQINAQSLPPDEIPNNDTDSEQACTENQIKHGTRTALMYAAANGGLATIRLLLAAGADTRLKDSEGNTALDYLTGKGPVPANPKLSPADQAEASKLLTPQ
jgi:uncharacterized protein YecT (DUF1311 family)